jgi:hypothetical protein
MLTDDFRAGVEEGNLDQIGELFREDAVFRSPAVFKPSAGALQGRGGAGSIGG